MISWVSYAVASYHSTVAPPQPIRGTGQAAEQANPYYVYGRTYLWSQTTTIQTILSLFFLVRERTSFVLTRDRRQNRARRLGPVLRQWTADQPLRYRPTLILSGTTEQNRGWHRSAWGCISPANGDLSGAERWREGIFLLYAGEHQL